MKRPIVNSRKFSGRPLPDDVEQVFITAIDRLYRHAHSESIKRGIRMKKLQREMEQKKIDKWIQKVK